MMRFRQMKPEHSNRYGFAHWGKTDSQGRAFRKGQKFGSALDWNLPGNKTNFKLELIF
jgi:hypothetical protein